MFYCAPKNLVLGLQFLLYGRNPLLFVVIVVQNCQVLYKEINKKKLYIGSPNGNRTRVLRMRI